MDCVIIGAGGHGKVVCDILRAAGGVRITGFLDADPSLAGKTVAGLNVLGPINLLPKLRQKKVRAAIVAIGDNRARDKYARLVVEQGLELISAIHPAATISQSATIGKNVVVAAGAIICTDAKLADSVIANTGCIIDHECEIGTAAHICPGAALAGRVRVGEMAFIGLGARILPCRSVSAGAIVGAGAVVTQDVTSPCTVVGIPARPIRVAA